MYSHIYKSHLYQKVLPQYGIKKAHVRADGAGCFSSHEVKAAIGIWEELCFIIEESYKTMVPGCRKTNLDGMFGVLSRHLAYLISQGHSFSNARELYELLRKYPLKHTEFHLYVPQRGVVDWNVTKSVVKLGLNQNYLLAHEDGKPIARAHSRRGQPKELDATLKEFASSFFATDDGGTNTGKCLMISRKQSIYVYMASLLQQ